MARGAGLDDLLPDSGVVYLTDLTQDPRMATNGVCPGGGAVPWSPPHTLARPMGPRKTPLFHIPPLRLSAEAIHEMAA